MKIYSKVSVFLLGVFLLFGVCNQMVMADKVAQVKLKNGTTYEYIFSTFDIGWSSTVLTQDAICVQNTLDYSNLNRVYWYAYSTNTCNWLDEWEFDVTLWDDSFPYLGFIPVTNESVTGTLYGTSTTLTLPYSDIDYVQFYDKACSGTWQRDANSYYLYDICYSSGLNRYVTVGTNGNILYGDHFNWYSATSGTTTVLKAIIHDGQKFMVVGYGGLVKTSTDGASWTAVSSFTTTNLRGVAYGNSTYVAVGDNGSIFSSSNGTTWTSRTSGVTDRLYDVVYGNSMFVVVGYNGRILTSTDGITWTSRTTGTTNYLNSVTWGDGLFVVVGQSGKILTSTNGTTWTSRTSGTTNVLYGVAYGAGVNQYVAVGHYSTILTSSDGITWSATSLGLSDPIYGMVYGNFGFTGSGDGMYLFKACN